MSLIIDKFRLNDFFINGRYIEFPTAYLAYVDSDGSIKNLKGDTYTKKKTNLNVSSPIKPANEESEYYDIVKVDLILSCEDYIVNPKRFVFLINNTLYDIFGNEIKLKKETKDINEINLEIETDPDNDSYNINCEYINIDFNGIIDTRGNSKYFVDGNIETDNGAFIFDGSTSIRSNITSLQGDWTIRCVFKPVSKNNAFESVLCFSKDGGNVFNILIKDTSVYLYANSGIKNILDLGSNFTKYIDIIVTSKGDVFINSKKITNVGKIDLSKCNYGFILGGDYNIDGSINNYFVGTMKYFGVCQFALEEDQINKVKKV